MRRIQHIQQNSGNILQFTGNRNYTQRTWNLGDATSGDGFATFLLGYVAGSQNYPLYPFNRQWYFAPYFQDDWKVNRKLTLNLGFRWDYNGPPDEKWNRMNRGFNATAASPIAQQIPAAMLVQYPHLRNLQGGLEFVGVNGNPRTASNKDWNNFQPRVGVAYAVNDKLVLRGGYRLYFLNPNNNFLQFAGFSNNTPIIDSVDGGRTPINTLANPYPTGILLPVGSSQGLSTFAGRNQTWFDPNFKTPYMHQFSFGFQFQTTKSSTLEVTYVGSRSRDLNNERDFNLPSLDYRKTCNILEGGLPANCQALTPNPYKGAPAFAGATYFTAENIAKYDFARPFSQFSGNMLRQGLNGSNIWYNSMQVNYNQRMGNGLMILANYTLSKTVEQWGYTDPFANQQQRGLYFNDRPHFAKVDPGNWKGQRVRGWSPCVVRMDNNGVRTAQAFSIAEGCGTDLSTYSWLLLPTYAPRATPFRSGQIRKHHAFTADASIIKRTQFTERLRAEFRAEAFNLFNHNYFGRDSFNTDPNSPNFGTVTPSIVSTQNSNPRQIQLGLKFYF